MVELTAARRAGRWRFSRRDASCADPEVLSTAGATGRATVWRAAQALTASSPWSLEYFKASLGAPEMALGLAEILAAGCDSRQTQNDSLAHFSVCAPDAYVHTRTAIRALSGRGLAVAGSRLQTAIDRAQFVIAALAASLALLAYIARFSRHRAPASRRDGTFLAVHGEWSNRTRHVLGQLGSAFAPDAIIVLGRIRNSPAHIARNWSDKLGVRPPPAFIPVSALSATRAIPHMLGLLRHGLRLAPQQPYLPGLRDHTAIVFRVLLGAIMQQWWKDSGISGGKVVYGHTGTADTSMLETAQQCAGAKSVHAVHGVATGPNFLGFSDIAIFRCGHDAQLYRGLRQYGRCIAPPAPETTARRGDSGILLLTNLAHPLNPGYIAAGLADELRVLRDVATVADELGQRAKPLLWKPHPVLSSLPQPLQDQLTDQAKSLGYALVAPHETLRDRAAQARWTIVTPSTVALDLLIDGYLCVVMNWQASDPDAGTSLFPTRVTDLGELRDMLNHLAADGAYHEYFQLAWSRLAPARALNLAVALEGLA